MQTYPSEPASYRSVAIYTIKRIWTRITFCAIFAHIMAAFAPSGPDVVRMLKSGELQAHHDKGALKAKAYTDRLKMITAVLQKEVGEI